MCYGGPEARRPKRWASDTPGETRENPEELHIIVNRGTRCMNKSRQTTSSETNPPTPPSSEMTYAALLPLEEVSHTVTPRLLKKPHGEVHKGR